MELQDWIDKGVNLASEYGIKIIAAIAIWIIGSWIIKKIMRGLTKVTNWACL